MSSLKEICFLITDSSQISKKTEILDPFETIFDKIFNKMELEEACLELMNLNESNKFRLKLITYVYPFLV